MARPKPDCIASWNSSFVIRFLRPQSHGPADRKCPYHESPCNMDIQGWDERYATGVRSAEDLETAPAKLVVDTASRLSPGRALDLACGAGRNTLWLASNGWNVTAVDGSQAAIEILRKRATALGLSLTATVADLQKGEYQLVPNTWDMVTVCYYLQRNLIEPAKESVRPGGCFLIIVHITEPAELPYRNTPCPRRAGKLLSWLENHSLL